MCCAQLTTLLILKCFEKAVEVVHQRADKEQIVMFHADLLIKFH